MLYQSLALISRLPVGDFNKGNRILQMNKCRGNLNRKNAFCLVLQNVYNRIRASITQFNPDDELTRKVPSGDFNKLIDSIQKWRRF